MSTPNESVAYFTMEVALSDDLPTFSGGLGVLAGDVLRSAADAALPVVAMTMCWRGGYFRQSIDEAGHQHEQPVAWSPEQRLVRLPEVVEIELCGHAVKVGCWRLDLEGAGGGRVPVYFLDTDLEANTPQSRAITDQLYGGDEVHRLLQEAVLGIGGVAMLDALGERPAVFHMNEGHSALLTLALFEAASAGKHSASAHRARTLVWERCAFTTHTPVAAGHDSFAAGLVAEVLGPRRSAVLEAIGQLAGGRLDMTELGMSFSHYVNGVSLRHREVAQELAPTHRIESVTNGVHLATWAAPAFVGLFDRHAPNWRVENAALRYVGAAPLAEIAAAHGVAKARLFEEVYRRSGRLLDPAALTIGLARRATPYKQTTLLFSDLERLREIARHVGPLQILCSGKAHPHDEEGKALITEIVAAAEALRGAVEVIFLADYGLGLAKLLCAGTDLWLNTPLKPYEASGTSGMKAAVNGVPSLSTLDGWWIEGWIEGVTGWAVGGSGGEDDAAALYRALGEVVGPCYYGNARSYEAVMRHAISLNASFFNTERVVREYARAAYRPGPPEGAEGGRERVEQRDGRMEP